MSSAWPAVLATCLALLIGCSGGSDDPSAGDPPDTSPNEEELVIPSDGSSETPLEDALGGIEGIVDRRSRAIGWRQSRLAECMEARGFNYVPSVPSKASLRYDYLVGKYEVLSADPAFRERWGYGVATRFAPDGSTYPYDGALLVEDPDFEADPNEALVRGLSQEQQRQREFALFGSESTSGEAGCTQLVEASFESEFPAFVALTQLEAELSQQASSAPQLAAARDDWIECMREAGFEVFDLLNPPTDIDLQVGQLQSSGQLSEATLLPLRDRELTMASVDWQCREHTVNPIRIGLIRRVEVDFLERAPDLIEDLDHQGP